MSHIKRHQSNSWHPKDIDFLIDNYGRMKALTMAVELNRSLTSVESQLYKLRKMNLIEGIEQKKKCQPVSSALMTVNKNAVQSETLFLIGYGDYPMFYKRRVRDGLAKAMKERELTWFWDRRDWILSRWLEFFSAA